MRRLSLFASTSAVAAAVACLAGPARAQTPEELKTALDRLAARLEEQDRAIADQQAALRAQAHEIQRLRTLSDPTLAMATGTGGQAAVPPSGPALPPAPGELARTPPPGGPVGAPPPAAPPVEVAAVPEGYGVLLPPGKFVVEPSIDYTHGSSNRLVFRGVEIVTGVQIGVIEASDADRNSASAALSTRYGVMNGLEVELRVPYLYRDDRITTLAQQDESITRTYHLEGQGLGDVELSARYQINRGTGGWPVLLAGVRVKSDTGTSPFDVPRDEFAVATELATGSGFWAVDGSLSFLYPTDPIVLFGGISYLSHQPRKIGKTIGDVPVNKVDPGDSISGNMGFGFALNPRFSFSLGYKHTYVFPTKTIIANTRQESESLNVGAFTFGWSLQLTRRVSIANTYEIGTTSDSPDARIVLRIPIRF